MTVPKIRTIHRGGARYYEHPGTDERVPGVTSVLGMLPKPFLKAWAAKEVAKSAVASGPDWLRMMLDTQGDDATVDFLKKAPDRNTREAADIGTAAHGIFEALILGQSVGEVTPALEPFVAQFSDLLDKIQPEPVRTEDTVWSEKYDYAGSFDLLAKVDGRLCWVDNKTTRSGVYPEVALQLSAYAHADYILGEDGSQTPVPEADHGLVFHIRPEGWKVFEVPIGDEVFEYFLKLRDVFNWDHSVAKTVVGHPVVKGAA